MSRIVSIDASPKQLSKLRNGHRVRIKQGTGFNVVVHPETFHVISRAFKKSKGVELKLSDEELDMNREIAPEQHAALAEAQGEIVGQGIFGKKFDKFLAKKGIKKEAYALAREMKPGVKAGISAALAAGGTALGAVQPELIPFIAPGVLAANQLAYSYLDKPDTYQRGFSTAKSGIKGKPIRSLVEQEAKAHINDRINQQMGTNYDYMGRAGIQKAGADRMSQELADQAIRARELLSAQQQSSSLLGYGFKKRMTGGQLEQSVRGKGQLINTPPALMSQPLGVNYQMSVMLPPQYQRFNDGTGYMGSGLYAGGPSGRGLYA